MAVTVRTGAAEFLAENPPVIWLTTALPRAVLQTLFLTLLGRVAAGERGEQFAFVGAVAVILTLSTMVGICDVPMFEKWFGTFYRLQTAVWRPWMFFMLRSLPWVTEAIVSAAVCIVVVGPLTGQGGLTLDLLRAFPVFVLMAFTSAAAGSAAASFAVGRRADVLVGNAFSYLTLVAAGALIPVGNVPLLEQVGKLLPLRNGILGIRDLIAGRPWFGDIVAECAVGIVWGVLAGVLYQMQSARARRTGIDDYA